MTKMIDAPSFAFMQHTLLAVSWLAISILKAINQLTVINLSIQPCKF